MTTDYLIVPSPCGDILITASAEGITGLHFIEPGDEARISALKNSASRSPTNPHITACKEQLVAYFAGTLTEFDMQLDPEGTDFQKEVWQALLEIPYGETCSYGELAKRLGKPSASRAVGAANGRNPIAIVVPCHRVIGANGTLTGYAGGLDRKQQIGRAHV